MFCTNGQIPLSLLAFTSFYLCGSIASYASAGIKADLSIRSSVCLSITCWYRIKTNGHAASRLHHRHIARKTLEDLYNISLKIRINFRTQSRILRFLTELAVNIKDVLL